jgi:hypothetical protein
MRMHACTSAVVAGKHTTLVAPTSITDASLAYSAVSIVAVWTCWSPSAAASSPTKPSRAVAEGFVRDLPIRIDASSHTPRTVAAFARSAGCRAVVAIALRGPRRR